MEPGAADRDENAVLSFGFVLVCPAKPQSLHTSHSAIFGSSVPQVTDGLQRACWGSGLPVHGCEMVHGCSPVHGCGAD